MTFKINTPADYPFITIISREKSFFDGRAVSTGETPLYELCVLCANGSDRFPVYLNNQAGRVYTYNFDIDEGYEGQFIACAPGSIIVVPSESKKFILDTEFIWYEWNPSGSESQTTEEDPTA